MTSFRALNKPISTYLLWLFVVVVLSSIYYTGGFRMGAFYTADALYVPDLVNDLHDDPGQLAHWNFSRAPSFLDVTAFYLIRWFADTYHALVVFFSLQLLWLMVLIRQTYAGVCHRHMTVALTWVSFLGFALILAAQHHPYFLALKSAHHFASFLIWLYASLVLMRFVQQQNPDLRVFIPLLMVGCVSDQILIVHLVLPALLLISVFWFTGSLQTRQYGWMSALLLAAVVCSLLITEWLSHQVSGVPQSQALNFEFEWQKLGRFLTHYHNLHPWLSLWTVVFYVGALWRCLRDPKNNVWLMFVLLSLVTTILILVVSEKNILNRYLLPFLMVPVMLPWVLLGPIRQGRLVLTGVWLITAGMVLVLLMSLRTSGFVWSYYPEHIRCVDDAVAEHSTTLVGDYWAARQYSFVSDRVQVDPFGLNFVRDPKVNNPTRFNRYYSGFLTDSVDGRGFKSAEVIKRFGEPLSQIECSKIKVLLYNEDSLTTDENLVLKVR